jgi:RNA polymerase sigma-70 factor (ECF subfamily)
MTSTLRLARYAPAPEADHDEALVGLAARDLRAGVEAVVREHRESLFRHAAWILKDHEEAIDITQEVFVRALREPRFFDLDFQRKAWLFRVTTNLCFNQVRDRRRRGEILQARAPSRDEQVSVQPDVVHHAERREQVSKAMEELSEAHREILTLRYYGDLSYAEISDALGIRLGTVMSRLSRAREALMESLRASGVVEEIREEG